MAEWMIPFLAALGTGILSAWGVGGGTLLLVVMTLFLGVGHREAQAVNLLFFLPDLRFDAVYQTANDILAPLQCL